MSQTQQTSTMIAKYSSNTSSSTTKIERSSNDDQVLRNMCRPPVGWPPASRAPIPPLPMPPTKVVVPTSSGSCSRSKPVQSSSTDTITHRVCTYDFDRHWKKMEAEVAGMHSYMNDFMQKMDRMFFESLKVPPTNICIKKREEFFNNPDPVTVHDDSGDCRIVYTVDLDGFKPEEIRVTLNADDGIIAVEAKHEEKELGQYVKRLYSRKFTVSDDLKASLTKQSFRSFLNDQGQLSIEAPLHREVSCLRHSCPSSVSTLYRKKSSLSDFFDECTRCPACKQDH